MDLRLINFGIEIETVKRTRERVAQAIHSVVGGQIRHIGSPGSFDPWEVTDNHGRVWKVVSDGSLINVPVHLRAEVVSPVLSYEDIPALQEVVRHYGHAGPRWTTAAASTSTSTPQPLTAGPSQTSPKSSTNRKRSSSPPWA